MVCLHMKCGFREISTRMNSSQSMTLKEFVNNILNKSRAMSTAKGQNVHGQQHKHIKK